MLALTNIRRAVGGRALLATPTRRRIAVAAVALGVLVPAAAGAYHLSRRSPQPRPTIAQRQAEQLVDQYRRDTIARIPGGPKITEAVRTSVPCDDHTAPGRARVASHYDLVFGSGVPTDTPEGILKAVRGYWAGERYRVVNDTAATGQTRQLLVENPADGFRIGLTQRTGRSLRLAVSSSCVVPVAAPVNPVSLGDLAGPQAAYQLYVAEQLRQLATQINRVRAAIAAGEAAQARAAWLPAQLTWEHVGAAYGSFAELGDAIDGLPNGLPSGVDDPGFTGLHRIEYGLWHGQAGAQLLTVADKLVADVAELRAKLPQLTVNPTDLPIRAHEILEDALRGHLSGITDQGSGAGYAETHADVAATRTVLNELAPLINDRRSDLLPIAATEMNALQQVLLAAEHDGAWTSPAAAPQATRSRVNAAIDALLETLAPVPDLLELRNS